MKHLSSHQFPEVYKSMNINLSKLGCVMLDIETKISHYDSGLIDKFYLQASVDFDNLLYYSKNKEHFWIDGWIADKCPHITLLYGLLEQAIDFAPYIEKVLQDWKLKEVEIEEISFFDSPYLDEEYYCIIAHIKKTSELLEGHKRLSFLPHINTFADYSPHLTIAYIKKEDWVRDSIITDLKKALIGKSLRIKERVNLGGNK